MAAPRSTYTGGNGSFLKLPGKWSLYSGKTLVEAQDASAVLAEGTNLYGFSKSAISAADVVTSSDDVAGILLSAPLLKGATSDIIRGGLVTNIVELLATGVAKANEDFTPIDIGTEIKGERAVLDVSDRNGKKMRLLQITATNKDLTRVWVLGLACSIKCFENQKELIESIASNWKVEIK